MTARRSLKAMFNDAAFRARLNLAAINSINWGRIMAQAVYYVSAALALGGPWRRVAFAVPSGNFGDVYAGYVAHKMGLPIAQLIVATNRNDILARFFASGIYSAGEVPPTMSPSMDIQVASNFERLLYDLCAGDGAEVARLMAEFGAPREPARTGRCPRPRARAVRCRAGRARMRPRRPWRRCCARPAQLVDPHTAVGIRAGRACRLDPQTPAGRARDRPSGEVPGCGAPRRPASARRCPTRLADLYERPERCAVLPNDLAAVQRHIQQLAREAA